MRYAKKEVSTKRPDATGTVVEVKFEVEVPQYESVAEYVSAAGGEQAALEYVNGAVATSAGNGARAYVRGADAKAPLNEIQEKANTISRGYTPTGGDRGPSKKERLATFDALMAKIRGGSLPSAEELEAIAGKFGA